MNCWLQHADYSAEDYELHGSSQIVNYFTSVDWTKENLNFQSMTEANKDCCPPGFGITSKEHGILHLCPDEKFNTLIHFHERRPIKLLGITLCKVSKNHSMDNVDKETCLKLITEFCDGDINALVAHIE